MAGLRKWERGDSPWSDATVVHLRQLWGTDLSATKIGRKLGVSKSAVISKAHRLDLPARRSPIKRQSKGSIDA
jgi:GcrA cell cycle regulator